MKQKITFYSKNDRKENSHKKLFCGLVFLAVLGTCNSLTAQCTLSSYSGNQLINGFTHLSGPGSTSNIKTNDYLLAQNTFTANGSTFDVVIKITGQSIPNGKLDISSDGNLELNNIVADDNPYYTYTLTTVVAGSATGSKPTGTPVTLSNVWITIGDIDGIKNENFGDVAGFATSSPPSQMVIGSKLKNSGFLKSGGPSGYNFYRPSDLSDAAQVAITDSTHSIQGFFSSFQTASLSAGATGTNSTTDQRSEALFIRSEQACASISGYLWDDGDASATKNGPEVYTNGGGIYANLVDNSTGKVLVSTLVDATTGAYSFDVNYSTTYKVILTNSSKTVGNSLSTGSLPTGWVATGTNQGGSTSTGNKTGIISVAISSSTSPGSQNFGIQQLPTATGSTTPAQQNSSSLVAYTIPPTAFVGNDPDGTIASIFISAFPANAVSITVNGTTYTSGTFPGAGITVPTDASGKITQTVSVKPAANSTSSISIPFYTIDNANGRSLATASVIVPYSGVLPVTFSNFDAQKQTGKSLLTWTTASESNSSYFAIERGSDGTNFGQVGKVAAAGNSAGPKTYSFTDFSPLPGSINYYRLKEVDIDGNPVYIATLSIDFGGIATIIKMFPNPTTDLVNITGLATGSYVSLIDANGKVLTQVSATGGNLNISLKKFAVGIYMLRVQAIDGNVVNLKVMKQ